MKSLVDFLNEAKSNIPQNVQDAIKHAMKYGYITQEENGKPVKYGISRENIFPIADEFGHEEVEKFIADLEKKGYKFRFETDDEWKKAGYEDPNE